jgi:hypothetical protein
MLYTNSEFVANTSRANLEYSMCEDDRIVAQLGDRTALLEETLKSHRAAVTLNPENTDVRFNTAQVLTSLAEAIVDDETQLAIDVPARTLLEEAVDTFSRCLEKQQNEYEKTGVEIARAQAEQEVEEQDDLLQQGDASEADREENTETSSTASSAPGEWATVEEPLTPETILETCTAQLNALAALLGLYDPAELCNIEERVQDGLSTAKKRVPVLIGLLQHSPIRKVEEPTGPTLSIASSGTTDFETTPKDDALLAVSNFQAAFADAKFRNGQITPTEYASTIEALFAESIQPFTSPHNSPAYLNAVSAYADALVDIAYAIADSPE